VPDTKSVAEGVTFRAFASPVFPTVIVTVTGSPTHPDDGAVSVPVSAAGIWINTVPVAVVLRTAPSSGSHPDAEAVKARVPAPEALTVHANMRPPPEATATVPDGTGPAISEAGADSIKSSRAVTDSAGPHPSFVTVADT
jgi:hypothetical protein